MNDLRDLGRGAALMLKRIKYVSRFAQPFRESELEELGKKAAEKNQALGITGVLMTSGGLFYQELEGPSEAVDELFGAITSDTRHTDLLVLSIEENVSDRLFPNWAMKAVNLDAAAHVRLLPLKIMMEAVFDQQQLVDKMVWAIERGLRQEFQSKS
jgi:hypothetical protein